MAALFKRCSPIVAGRVRVARNNWQRQFKHHGSGTLSVWGGELENNERGEYAVKGSTQVPIVSSISYGYDDLDTWHDVALGNEKGHIYSRNTNPTVAAFERKVATLEGTAAATSFSSGMAAISNTLFALLSPGSRVVSVKDCYGGTALMFLEFLPRFGIDVTLCDTGDADAIEAAVAKGCDMLYLETPTNPALTIVDIARLSAAAHAQGATVVCDNTFATPINQHPITLGADVVLHSASKFLGGHADAMGGVICGAQNTIDKIYHFREINGACLDPHAAYMLLRGMKTLQLRVQRQNDNALTVAEYLHRHTAVEKVYYPGLPSHTSHDIAVAQMPGGFGGMLSFTLKGGWDAVRTTLPQLQLAHRAANLGPVETVVGPPRTTSHVECTPEERSRLGIAEGLVRYSAGIEDVDDLLEDLDRALPQA
eukprot:m.441477 g.441477  ORF g.441477 m.441477 type:complete len:425 (-) comp21469_c1_seq16:148-1422(-)